MPFLHSTKKQKDDIQDLILQEKRNKILIQEQDLIKSKRENEIKNDEVIYKSIVAEYITTKLNDIKNMIEIFCEDAPAKVEGKQFGDMMQVFNDFKRKSIIELGKPINPSNKKILDEKKALNERKNNEKKARKEKSE